MLRTLPFLFALLSLLVSSAYLSANDPVCECKQPCENSTSPSACQPCQRIAPELWVLNSRCAPKCDCLESGFEQITYQRYDAASCRFVEENRELYLAAQANLPTMLFTHGNTLEHDAAMKSCWKVYERLKDCPGPKMLVFWSWPAEIFYKRPLLRPIELARVNIKAKYIFAERQGYYIAKLTNMMSPAQPVTLSGHSFGGVSAVCAAHFLAGGSIDCLTLPEGTPGQRSNLRVAIISGALDCDSLLPGQRYDKALDAVEKLYTTFSERDATLKRWPTHSFRGQQAIGYTGMCIAGAGENAYKIRQDRLTDDVGRSHYITPHLESHTMVNALCEMTFETSIGGSSQRGTGGRIFPGASELNRIIDSPATLIFPGLAL
jgi:hypothetical protein